MLAVRARHTQKRLHARIQATTLDDGGLTPNGPEQELSRASGHPAPKLCRHLAGEGKPLALAMG